MRPIVCSRCKTHVMDLAAGSIIKENTEALCSNCAMIRRGSELMLKDNCEAIRELKEEVRVLNKLVVTGSMA
jgi:DNA-directed RNA polymerase subunit RPC12/RpoP